MKRALGFGFWVTHGGRESLARISSCCLAFIFRLLCPISNCFGGLRFHFFYCARYPFYFVSLSLSRSLLRFQLVQIWYPCYAKLLYNYSGFTTSTSSVCHFSTSLIRIETNRIEGYLYAPQNVIVPPHCHCPAPILSPFRLFMIFTFHRVLPTGLWPSFSSHRPRFGNKFMLFYFLLS